MRCAHLVRQHVRAQVAAGVLAQQARQPRGLVQRRGHGRQRGAVGVRVHLLGRRRARLLRALGPLAGALASGAVRNAVHCGRRVIRQQAGQPLTAWLHCVQVCGARMVATYVVNCHVTTYVTVKKGTASIALVLQ